MSSKLENSSKKESAENTRLLYVLMQPTRQKIIKILRASKEPLNIQQIAEKVAGNTTDVSFHMSTLAEYGLVDGEYREIEPPKHHSPITGHAVKYYKITPKVDEAISRLGKEI